MRVLSLLMKAIGLVILWAIVTFVEVGVKAAVAVVMRCNRYRQGVKQRAISKRMAEDTLLMKKWADVEKPIKEGWSLVECPPGCPACNSTPGECGPI